MFVVLPCFRRFSNRQIVVNQLVSCIRFQFIPICVVFSSSRKVDRRNASFPSLLRKSAFRSSFFVLFSSISLFRFAQIVNSIKVLPLPFSIRPNLCQKKIRFRSIAFVVRRSQIFSGDLLAARSADIFRDSISSISRPNWRLLKMLRIQMLLPQLEFVQSRYSFIERLLEAGIVIISFRGFQ